MELKDLLHLLRRHWLPAVAAFAVVFALGAASAILPAATYATSATVSVRPSPDLEAGGQNAIQTANFLIPDYVEQLGSRTLYVAVRGELPAEVRDASVKVSASSDIGTGIIRVRASSVDPLAAAVWANGMAGALADQANEVDGAILRVTVLEEANVPVEPEGGATTVLIGSLVLALMAALLAALASGRLARILDAKEELRRRLRTAVLGEIPRIRGLRRSSKSLDVFLQDCPREVLEAFQTLRTNVELALGEVRPVTIAVMSFEPGEGKSTVAASLAISMAAVRHEVTIVDADLRRPAMHERLGEPFGDGLADVRADPVRLARRLRSGIRFLPAGIPDRHPADVISVALPRAIDALRRDDAVLLIDSPPLQGVAETPFIADAADHVLLVVDASTGKLPEVEAAVNQLRVGGVDILGIVINRTRRRRADQMNPYYAYDTKAEASASTDKAVALITGGTRQRQRRRSARSS